MDGTQLKAISEANIERYCVVLQTLRVPPQFSSQLTVVSGG